MTSWDLLSNCLRAEGLLATIIFRTIRGACSIQPLRCLALTSRWVVGCSPRNQLWEPQLAIGLRAMTVHRTKTGRVNRGPHPSCAPFERRAPRRGLRIRLAFHDFHRLSGIVRRARETASIASTTNSTYPIDNCSSLS